MVKDAAGQEARPTDAGDDDAARAALLQSAGARPRRAAADPGARRQQAAAAWRSALDALTIAPEKIGDSGVYLGLRVGYERLVNARSDDDLRGVLDYLWSMARAIEDGDMSDAEQRLNAARQALEQALEGRRLGAGDLAAHGRAAPGDAGVPAELHGGDGSSAACRTCRRCRRPGHADAVRPGSAEHARPHRGSGQARRPRRGARASEPAAADARQSADGAAGPDVADGPGGDAADGRARADDARAAAPDGRHLPAEPGPPPRRPPAAGSRASRSRCRRRNSTS